jgi:hypothetical protein
VDARWEAELVPVEGDRFGLQQNNNLGAPFDRAGAAAALAGVSVAHCSAGGQVGSGHVTVTFDTTGRVSGVVVDDPTFSGTPAGRCVAASFFRPAVAPFDGAPVRVGKSFTLR